MARPYRKRCRTHPTHENLRGRRFGRLVAKRFIGRHAKSKHAIWRCVCSCGGIKDALAFRLKQGKVISCGCLARLLLGRGNGQRAA